MWRYEYNIIEFVKSTRQLKCYHFASDLKKLYLMAVLILRYKNAADFDFFIVLKHHHAITNYKNLMASLLLLLSTMSLLLNRNKEMSKTQLAVKRHIIVRKENLKSKNTGRESESKGLRIRDRCLVVKSCCKDYSTVLVSTDHLNELATQFSEWAWFNCFSRQSYEFYYRSSQ